MSLGGYDPELLKRAAGSSSLGTRGVDPSAEPDASEEWTPSDQKPHGPPPFTPPPMPDAVRVDLADVPDDQRKRMAADYDSDVATRWAQYQGNVLGLSPEQRTALPPDFTPATKLVDKKGPDLAEGIHEVVAPPELRPDTPPDNPREPAGVREPTSVVTGRDANRAMGAPAPAAALPPAARGGGGGGSAPDPWGKRLDSDFNERIGAMQDEMAARQARSQQVADAYGNAAQIQRDNAMASEAQAHDNAEQERARIGEVEQLNRDYADGKIDANKWWTDRTVPQKIGTALGMMFAGWNGGVQGALSYYHTIVDSSIALQKDEIERKYKAGQMADNLLGTFMRTSTNEQEAMDKARAAMYGAAMVEVAQAGASAKGPEEQAQIRQLIADMKTTRDMALAKLSAQRAGATGSPRGLEVDPNMVVDVKGQQYLLPKADAEGVRTAVRAYEQLEGSVREGLGLLDQRGLTDYHPWSANVKQGEGVDATIQESLARLAGARGVPQNIQQIAHEALPQFGSLTAGVDRPKAERFLQMLDKYRQDALAGATPVDIQPGPGTGKDANKLTYWATPRQPTAAQPTPPGATPRTYGFVPQGQ
jgi:hypothetical protein